MSTPGHVCNGGHGCAGADCACPCHFESKGDDACAAGRERLDALKERSRTLADKALETFGARLEAGGSSAMREYLAVLERFRSYSFRNVLLIATQRPDATHVAGFHAWRELGRYVRKGEHGIAILAPMIRGKRDKATGDEREDGGRVFGFRVVYVFDVSQTDGAELPAAPSIHVEGGELETYARLLRFALGRGLAVREGVAPDAFSVQGAHGETDGRLIKLAAHLTGDTGALIGTLAHELAHALLHFPDGPAALGDLGRPVERGHRELEAEAVAYVVATAAGCQYTERMADYVVGWGGSRERLEGALGRIQAAARVLVEAVELETEAAPAAAVA